jgi:hypothetical protein
MKLYPNVFKPRLATYMLITTDKHKVTVGVQTFWSFLLRNAINLVHFLPRRSGFDPESVHVGFMVDKVALGQVFPRVLRFSPVNYIPPVFHYTEKGKNTNHFHHRVAQ